MVVVFGNNAWFELLKFQLESLSALVRQVHSNKGANSVFGLQHCDQGMRGSTRYNATTVQVPVHKTNACIYAYAYVILCVINESSDLQRLGGGCD